MFQFPGGSDERSFRVSAQLTGLTQRGDSAARKSRTNRDRQLDERRQIGIRRVPGKRIGQHCSGDRSSHRNIERLAAFNGKLFLKQERLADVHRAFLGVTRFRPGM